MDVLSASAWDDKIAWYENDGQQTFTPHTVTTSADEAWSVYAADVDGDGDMDVLSASYDDDKIAWYENDGQQTFTSHTITTAADGALSVYAADVDGDGDMDVLSASYDDDKIAWYENDGQQTFTTIPSPPLQMGQSVYAADVDGDGDMDVLSASYDDDKIAWYENDGQQTFTTHFIVTNADAANSVFAVDVDGDGDMDVLSASANDNKIAWYENLLITTDIEAEPVIGLPDSPMLHPNYPNPFNPRTTIAFDLPAAGPVTLKIYDLSGRLLATLVDQAMPAGHHKVRFNAGDLASGIYLYAIRTGAYSVTRKMVLLK
jgi:hypothetical protein